MMANTRMMAAETSAEFRVVDIGTAEGEEQAITYSPTALPTVIVERVDIGPVARFTGTFDFAALRKVLTT